MTAGQRLGYLSLVLAMAWVVLFVVVCLVDAML